jgi:hypothetical protein
MATKILPIDTVKYFSNIVLGISVDQSLNAYDSTYNTRCQDLGATSSYPVQTRQDTIDVDCVLGI